MVVFIKINMIFIKKTDKNILQISNQCVGLIFYYIAQVMVHKDKVIQTNTYIYKSIRFAKLMSIALVSAFSPF